MIKLFWALSFHPDTKAYAKGFVSRDEAEWFKEAYLKASDAKKVAVTRQPVTEQMMATKLQKFWNPAAIIVTRGT